MAASYKAKHCPATILLGISSNELKTCPHRKLHVGAYSSFMKAAEMSFSRRMDKHTVAQPIDYYLVIKRNEPGASLVVQWLRIRLPMQRTRVRALVPEDSTCCRASKLSLCTTTTEPLL